MIARLVISVCEKSLHVSKLTDGVSVSFVRFKPLQKNGRRTFVIDAECVFFQKF